MLEKNTVVTFAERKTRVAVRVVVDKGVVTEAAGRIEMTGQARVDLPRIVASIAREVLRTAKALEAHDEISVTVTRVYPSTQSQR